MTVVRNDVEPSLMLPQNDSSSVEQMAALGHCESTDSSSSKPLPKLLCQRCHLIFAVTRHGRIALTVHTLQKSVNSCKHRSHKVGKIDQEIL